MAIKVVLAVDEPIWNGAADFKLNFKYICIDASHNHGTLTLGPYTGGILGVLFDQQIKADAADILSVQPHEVRLLTSVL